MAALRRDCRRRFESQLRWMGLAEVSGPSAGRATRDTSVNGAERACLRSLRAPVCGKMVRRQA